MPPRSARRAAARHGLHAVGENVPGGGLWAGGQRLRGGAAGEVDEMVVSGFIC